MKVILEKLILLAIISIVLNFNVRGNNILHKNVEFNNLETPFLQSKLKSDKRIALVIGNSNYADTCFVNAENDAKLIGETLKKVNFDVTVLTDAKFNEVEIAIDIFIQKLNNDKDLTGLLYFTGNGYSIEGKQYFNPVDRIFTNTEEASKSSVCIDIILERLSEIKNYLNIIIIDLPRRNPFPKKNEGRNNIGLISQPDESILLYSTSPGNINFQDSKSANSLFAIELSKVIMLEKTEISEAAKILRTKLYKQSYPAYSEVMGSYNNHQMIWTHSKYSKEFYFRK